MVWTEQRLNDLRRVCAAWRGTPYGDRMGIVGVGVDCVHFLSACLEGTGVTPAIQFPAYDTRDGLWSTSEKLKTIIADCLTVTEHGPFDAVQNGDIAVGRTGNQSSHCGIIVDGLLWQSLAGHGVIQPTWRLWRHNMEYVLRLTATGLIQQPIDLGNVWQDMQA